MERGRTSRGEQGGKPEDSAVLAASLQRLPQEDGVITWVRLGWVVKGGRREDWPLKSATWGVIGDLDRFSSSGGSRPRAGDC